MYYDNSGSKKIDANISKESVNNESEQKNEIKNFLEILYKNISSDGFLVLWTKHNHKSNFYSMNDFEEISKAAHSVGREKDIYFGVGVQKEKPENGSRGKAETVQSIPGLWLDVDIKGPNHAADDLPPDRDSVWELLHAYKLKPTLIISTGGGYHAYWLFKEPLRIETNEAREKAKRLSSDFQSLFLGLANQKGWRIDNTSDLSRLLRLPGTCNHKNGNPVPIRIIEYNEDVRYNPDEIADSVTKTQTGIDTIPNGNRNTTLTSLGGGLRAQGKDYNEIYKELSEINKSCCIPPLHDEEVKSISKSVSGYSVEDDQNGRKPTQADKIVKLSECMELFHTPDGETYAAVPVNEHKEIWPLKSKGLRHFLSKAFYDRYGTSPGSQGLQNSLETLKGRAQFDSPKKDTFVRLAQSGDCIYLDLCNDNWEVVEISRTGWQIISDPPVYFRRPKGMHSLPLPEREGKLNKLRDVINVDKENEWVLIVSWLIGAFYPSGPYPILIVHGEQGSAKSTTARLLRELTDPSSAALRTLPRSERDLMIMANNSRVIAFDNLSGIKPWMSDALCRLSTGGGFSTRGLHTDSDEIIFDAMRPIIINGIDAIANRQDLADRAIIVNLPRIPEKKRMTEQDVWDKFEKAKPSIFGGILDTVSFALRKFNDVKLTSYPRMADFAKWVVAAEPLLPWREGSFIERYQVNQNESAMASFESDVVAMALKDFIEKNTTWEGTTTELKNELEDRGQYVDLTADRSWPKTPNYLSNRIKRIAPSLRSIGIEVANPTIQGRKMWRFNLKRQQGVDGQNRPKAPEI